MHIKACDYNYFSCPREKTPREIKQFDLTYFSGGHNKITKRVQIKLHAK